MSKVIMGNGGFYSCLSEPQGVLVWWKETAQTRAFMLSRSLLLNHLKPQSSKAKLLLPIMPIGIVAYAFTLLWDNLCRNSCIKNRLVTQCITMVERTPLTCWVLLKICVIPYAMYPPPYIEKTRTLTNPRMHLQQIGFVLQRIITQGERGVTCDKYIALRCCYITEADETCFTWGTHVVLYHLTPTTSLPLD